MASRPAHSAARAPGASSRAAVPAPPVAAGSAAGLPAAALPLPTKEARTLRGHRAPLQFAKFTPNGRYCVTGGQDRSLLLWNPYRRCPDADSAAAAASRAPDTGALLLKEYRGHGYEVLDACVSKGNDRIASVGGDRIAFLWDATTGAVIRKLFGHEQRINACAFNADASVLATGSNDKSVRLWDMRSASRAPIQVLDDAGDNVTAVVCEDGAIVSASMDGVIRTYDLRAGRLVEDHVGAPIVALAVSRDGACSLAASLKAGGELLLLERPAGVQLKRYAGHANALYRCKPSFSGDDAHVICGGENGAIHAWDLVTGAPAATLASAHGRVVASIDVHPDPAVVAMLSASFDGTAKLWLGPDTDPRALTLAGGGDDWVAPDESDAAGAAGEGAGAGAGASSSRAAASGGAGRR